MKYTELISINTIPKEIEKSLFEQSEQGLKHTPYREEVRLLSCVKEGNIDKLISQAQSLMNSGVFVGEMSADNLMQYRYMAVSAITLATRYAIQGGLSELEAYSFSDSFIRSADKLNSPDEIISLIISKIIELTKLVESNRKKAVYSPHIRKAIVYINQNITKKLTVKDIAKQCNITADYLSHLFKKETGTNLAGYILKEKLELAKTLIWEGYDNKRICYSLSFSSQSHFIASFKKEFGITPSEYLNELK